MIQISSAPQMNSNITYPVVMFVGTAEAGKAPNPSGAAVAVGRLNVTFLLLGGTAAVG